MAAFVKEFKGNEEFYHCQREDRLVGFPRTAQVSSTSVAVRTFTKRVLFQKTQKKCAQVTNAKCKARKGYGGQTCLGSVKRRDGPLCLSAAGAVPVASRKKAGASTVGVPPTVGSSDRKTASRETFFKEKGVKDPIKVRCLWSRLVTDRWSGRGSKAHGLQPPRAALRQAVDRKEWYR